MQSLSIKKLKPSYWAVLLECHNILYLRIDYGIIFLFFTILCFTSKINAQNEAIISRLDSLLTECQNKGEFSGAVSLSQHGSETVFENSYGFSNISDSIKNKTDTQFSLASLGKVFTMVAILKLVEQKKLRLNDSIKKYGFGFQDKRAEDITIKQLLSHTSGFGHYWENEHYLRKKNSLHSLAEYMDFIKDIPLDFQPGTKYQYSNVGYIILGKIIESVSRDSYYGHVNKTIFKPLGMNKSNFAFKKEIDGNYAKKYTKTSSSKLVEVKTDLSLRGASDGGGHSTVIDLSKFIKAIFYDGFLSDSSLSLMASNYEFEGLERPEWTFDLVGGAPGVSTAIGFHGPTGYSMIVLANMDSPASENVVLATQHIISEELSKPAQIDNVKGNANAIEGRVMDIVSGQPIPFVNIGIKNKGVGTASKENGSFQLEISNEHKDQNITFSALGYSEVTYSAQRLLDTSDLAIQLYPKTEILGEVVVTAKKPKIEKTGNSSLGMFSSGAYIGGRDPGAVLATKIKIPNDRAKLNKVFVHVRDNHLKENFKLRVRLMQIGENRRPDKDLLNKSVIISSNIKKGWLSFDLSKMNLVLKDDVFIGMEWIEELNTQFSMKDAYPRISYSNSNKAESCARTTSLNKWNFIDIAPNIYAEFIIY